MAQERVPAVCLLPAGPSVARVAPDYGRSVAMGVRVRQFVDELRDA